MTGDSADSLSPAQQEALRRESPRSSPWLLIGGRHRSDDWVAAGGPERRELLEYLTARSGAMA